MEATSPEELIPALDASVLVSNTDGYWVQSRRRRALKIRAFDRHAASHDIGIALEAHVEHADRGAFRAHAAARG